MPTIKDALDIINKLTAAEQESLKTMLLRLSCFCQNFRY